MSPPVELSVRRVRETFWVLGTSMVCECDSKPSANSIASWTDPAGNIFSVRKISEQEQELKSGSLDAQEAEADRMHQAGTGAAVWRLGDAFCKVKAWCEGMELEADAIAFARQNAPSVPVPEVLCTWIDHSWNRSFIILRAVKGETLARAWPLLTDAQRQRVASAVASFCEELASTTSSNIQSASGCGTLEPFLTAHPPAVEPSWKPHLLGPLSVRELHIYLTKINSDVQMEFGDTFNYYHADLGPTNILVSNQGEINGIIDWESAGFYPRFWIGTKPLVSAGFFLNGTDIDKRKAWSTLLSRSLEEKGFMSHVEHYQTWRSALGK
jgi:Phosphotransferase enzyme family